MAKFRTTDTDLGIGRILKELSILEKKPFVEVGLQESTFSKPKKTSDKQVTDTTVLEVGVFQEFGTKSIPQRSYIRLTFDETKKSMFQTIKRQKDLIFLGASTVKKSLNVIGLQNTNNIKKTIRRTPSEWPPLSESTIKRKKSSKPLIDTGQLINSLTHKVTIK